MNELIDIQEVKNKKSDDFVIKQSLIAKEYLKTLSCDGHEVVSISICALIALLEELSPSREEALANAQIAHKAILAALNDIEEN